MVNVLKKLHRCWLQMLHTIGVGDELEIMVTGHGKDWNMYGHFSKISKVSPKTRFQSSTFKTNISALK